MEFSWMDQVEVPGKLTLLRSSWTFTCNLWNPKHFFQFVTIFFFILSTFLEPKIYIKNSSFIFSRKNIPFTSIPSTLPSPQFSSRQINMSHQKLAKFEPRKMALNFYSSFKTHKNFYDTFSFFCCTICDMTQGLLLH